MAYKIGYRAYTITGDVCDPDGGMQGGKRQDMGRLITTCQSLRLLNLERRELQQKVGELRGRIDLYQR